MDSGDSFPDTAILLVGALFLLWGGFPGRWDKWAGLWGRGLGGAGLTGLKSFFSSESESEDSLTRIESS